MNMRTTITIVLAAMISLLAAQCAIATTPFGETIMDRDYSDGGWYNVTLLDMNAAAVAPVDGKLVDWRLWARNTGQIKLRVFRDVGTDYLVVGENLVTVTGTGAQTIPILPAQQITVQAGDFLGFRYEDDTNIIPFSWETGSAKYTYGDSQNPLPKSWFTDTPRTYSLAADLAPIPEPASIVTLALGCLTIFRRRRS